MGQFFAPVLGEATGNDAEGHAIGRTAQRRQALDADEGDKSLENPRALERPYPSADRRHACSDGLRHST